MICGLLCVQAAWASAQPPRFDFLAIQNEQAPNGTGVLFGVGSPRLNNQGDAAFAGFVRTEGGALYRGNAAPGSLVEIVREGQATPDGLGQFGDALSFRQVKINDLGQVAFESAIVDGSGVARQTVYIGDGTSTGLVEVIRAGNDAPDRAGVFVGGGTPVAFADSGRALIATQLDLQDGGSNVDESAVYRFDPTPGTLTKIAREGDPTPDGTETLNFVRAVGMTEAGEAAFVGASPSVPFGGVFLGDGASSPQEYGRSGDPAPRGPGDLYLGGPCALDRQGCVTDGLLKINNSQTLVAKSYFDIDADPFPLTVFEAAGLVRIDGPGASLETLVRSGDPVPDGSGNFLDIGVPSFNDAGDIVFSARLMNTPGGTSDDSGLYRIADTTVIEVFREGDDVPTGDGAFDDFFDPNHPRFNLPVAVDVNETGQFLFRARMTGTPNGNGDDEALFLYDFSLGLEEIVREGETLFNDGVAFGTVDAAFGDLNDNGEVGILFEIRPLPFGSAIRAAALWPGRVPEPASLALSAAGALACGLLRGRKLRRLDCNVI